MVAHVHRASVGTLIGQNGISRESRSIHILAPLINERAVGRLIKRAQRAGLVSGRISQDDVIGRRRLQPVAIGHIRIVAGVSAGWIVVPNCRPIE